MERESENLRIDVDSVLRERVPRLRRYLPDAAVRWLERVICQQRMNEILERTAGLKGVDFARGVLRELNVSYDVKGRWPVDSRVIFVSNHPLGGLDGLVLASAVSEAFGDAGVRFVVNDLLKAVKPLDDIFLAVNKHGKQSRQAVKLLDEAMLTALPVVMFPAGLVSRRNSAGEIRDLQWQKMVVNKAKEYGRPIIPVHFSGENSSFFYKFARIRAMTGLKFNIEMILLPGEIFRSEGRNFTVTVGEPVNPDSLRGGKYAAEEAQMLCSRVYGLVNQQWKK